MNRNMGLIITRKRFLYVLIFSSECLNKRTSFCDK